MSAKNYSRPDYAVQPLESRIAKIVASHATEPADRLEAAWRMAQRDELQAMRRYVDGDVHASDFWYREGYRRETDAREHAFRLAVFRDALARTDTVYVRCGREFCPDTWLVYARDTASPSGVSHVASMSRGPEADALVDASGRCTLSPTEGLARNARL